MRIRKNAIKLPPAERQRFVNALKALKAETVVTLSDGTRVSRYDQIVALHIGVTVRFLNGAQISDGGHRGPAFLPWHRKYMLLLEEQLRQVDSSVTLPYWDWENRDGTRDVLFQDDFMGPRGNGSGPVGPVRSGHFTVVDGWPLIDEIHRPGASSTTQGTELLRATSFNFNSLPTPQTIDSILSLNVYEPSFGQQGFRGELESGPHNQLHPWVGGSNPFQGIFGTMSGMSSPNDPIFFLHHGAVDWMWARWQDDGHSGPAFYPDSVGSLGGRSSIGHALREPMWPWDGGQAATAPFILPYLPPFPEIVRPEDVLDFRALGFTYDTLLPMLSIGSTINNVDLSSPGDEQGFRVIAASAGQYEIETHGVINTVMSLHGPDGWEQIVQSSGGGSGENARIVANLNPGTYYVVVRHGDVSGTGSFNISLQAADVVSDPLILMEVNGPMIQAEIGQGGEEDRYRFEAAGLGDYVIETEGPTDVFMTLFGPDSPQSQVAEDDDSGQERNARIRSRLSPGSYQVRIRHYFPTGVGSYGISVRRVTEETPAVLVVDGPEVQSEIGVANESDLYQFEISSPGAYIVRTSGPTDTFLTLLGPDSETTVIAVDDDSGPSLLSRIEQQLDPGVYFVRVRHYSPTATGPYGVSVVRA